MLENMLAEASSTLDNLAAVVHLSPETAGAVTTSATASTTVTPCRSNISTPSPPPCDDYDDPPKASRVATSLSSDVLSSVGVDESVKTSASPLFSMESSNSSLHLQDSELLQTTELSHGKNTVSLISHFTFTFNYCFLTLLSICRNIN